MTKKRKSPIALSLADSLEAAIRTLAKASGRTLTSEISIRLQESLERNGKNQPLTGAEHVQAA